MGREERAGGNPRGAAVMTHAGQGESTDEGNRIGFGKTDLDWYKPDPVDLRNRGTTARERTLVCITDRAWVCMARKFFLKSPTPSIRPRELIGLYKTTETPQGTKRRRPKKPQLRDQMPIVSVNPEAR